MKVAEAGNQAHRWLDIVPPPHVGITDQTNEAVGLKNGGKKMKEKMKENDIPRPVVFKVMLMTATWTDGQRFVKTMEQVGQGAYGTGYLMEQFDLMQRNTLHFAVKWPQAMQMLMLNYLATDSGADYLDGESLYDLFETVPPHFA